MIKGIHIDLKAHTANFSYLMQILREIRDLGFNTILLEYQDKFPFEGEYKKLSSPDALTIEQVEEIKHFCKGAEIEIIPLMQCLGHMYWVTRFDEFKMLGESFAEQGAGSHSLCPSKEESFALFCGMAEQVMKLHNESRYFHIGGDEIHFSKACTDCRGKDEGALLGGYYERAIRFVTERGFIPAMWGDMIVKYEDVKRFINRDTLVFDWDYTEGLSEENGKSLYPDEASYSPYSKCSFANTKKLAKDGFCVVCAPAVRSMGDSCFLPRSVHFDNCLQAICEARRHGAAGFVITSWAVRRGLWGLTKNVLSAAVRFAENPKFTAREMRMAFAKDTFGDERLSELPFELADAVHAAKATADFLSSGCDFMDAKTGHFLPDSIKKRLGSIDIRHNDAVKSAYEKMLMTARECKVRLLGAEVNDDTKMWLWACDNAVFYGTYILELCDNFENREWLEKQLKKLDAFCDDIVKPLGEYLTEFSMEEEMISRVEVHKEYLNDLLKGVPLS